MSHSAISAVPVPLDEVCIGEQQYLDLLRNVMRNGDPRMDRTGVGTRSLFGAMLRFDLSSGRIPLLTTKRVAWSAAIREMLWFLSGSTNIRPLVEAGVHIWTDWPLAKYRKHVGRDITRDEFEAQILADSYFAERWGDLGPVYGKQWRKWHGPDGEEYDQVANVIQLLRTNPTSRRILFHGWNVAEVDAMALPPCHLLYQFHVSQGNRLNCLLYQRSADLFLGLPFNLVGASALLAMLADQAGLQRGELVWTGGDVHLYENHIDAAWEQLGRMPNPAPLLHVRKDVAGIDDYSIHDFVVSDYSSHPAIRAPVAV
jgi:thymidylate synthase